MLLLSVDVGIRNLALCLLEVGVDDAKGTRVVKWQVADLAPQKTCSACDRPASLSHVGVLWCRRCASTQKPAAYAPTPGLIKACTGAYDPGAVLKLGIAPEHATSKASVRRFVKQHVMVPYKHPPASSAPLPQVAVSLDRSLLAFLDGHRVDVAAIENQIGPQAIRMKAIQAMVTQCLVCRATGPSPPEVVYVSAGDKLRPYAHAKKIDYGTRKKLAIEVCEHMLARSGSPFIEQFQASTKKDDLADSYLQGVSVLAARGFDTPAGWGEDPAVNGSCADYLKHNDVAVPQ